MKTLPALFAVALAGCAATPPSMDVPASLAAAETAFAAHSMRENMRPAFLANFADDGMTPREHGWVASNEFLAARPNPPIVLDWRPQYVEAAASGDLGLSTGPTKLVANARPDVTHYGQYVSIWRRQDGGPWKVIVDLGISNATPVFWDQPLQAAFVQGARGALDPAALLEAEAAFSRLSAASGARSAYGTLASERLRFYRDNGGPAVGLAAAKAGDSEAGVAGAGGAEAGGAEAGAARGALDSDAPDGRANSPVGAEDSGANSDGTDGAGADAKGADSTGADATGAGGS